jgi:hypothetical protein
MRVLQTSKSGCRDTLWVQSIQCIFFNFFLGGGYLRRAVLKKNITFVRMAIGILQKWPMNRMGCPCGIPFCSSFPLGSYFSSTKLVKKSRSKNPISLPMIHGTLTLIQMSQKLA